MTPLLIYLLKMAACSGLFYLYYLAALRNRLFHQWNRFYLLAAVAFSLLIPLLRWDLAQSAGTTDGQAIRLLRVMGTASDYLEEITVTQRASWSAADWLLLGYAGVTVVLLALFFRSLLRIFRLVRTHAVQVMGRIHFMSTRVPGTPFSFLHYIFWNEDIDLQSATGQQIFQHELVHIEQKHSWDKIFLQLALIVFWCNPFFWLIRRELWQVHEFIADRRSVGHHGAAALAAMILQSAYPQQYNQLTQSFFQTPIKRRLFMLSKMQNPRLRYFGRLLALPVFAFAILAFTVKMQPVMAHAITPLQEPITVVIDAGHGQVNDHYSGAHFDKIYEDEIVLQLAKKVQALNNNANVRILLSRSNTDNIDLKQRVAVASSYQADLFLSLHLNFAPQGDSPSSDMLRSSGIEVFVPKDAAPYQAQSELFGSALQQELTSAYKTYPGLLKHSGHIWVLDNNVVPSVLVECGYLSNAGDRDFVTKESNQNLLAQKILNAIQSYASQRERSTPVTSLVAQPVNTNADLKPSRRTDTVPAPKADPIYIVDGKELDKNALNSINPNFIQSMNVVKGDNALAKYGERGRNGVVEIFMKPGWEDAQKQWTPPAQVAEDTSQVFVRLEIEAKVDPAEWRKFLETNLQPIVEKASRKAPPGQYTLAVRFLVERDGGVTDVTILNDPGYGIASDVKKMMAHSPKWVPGMQNGRAVRSYHTQPITFVISK